MDFLVVTNHQIRQVGRPVGLVPAVHVVIEPQHPTGHDRIGHVVKHLAHHRRHQPDGNDEGNQQAWAKPGGAIVRLLISKILQPIHGARAQNASRRTIDQFGFGKSFELIIRYSAKAQAENALTLNYTGEGSVGDRPTYQFERLLPYDGNEDNYPDRLLVFHIDQESLLPVACYAYSDKEGNDLLGSYIYTDVKLNPGYSPEDFDPDVINF